MQLWLLGLSVITALLLCMVVAMWWWLSAPAPIHQNIRQQPHHRQPQQQQPFLPQDDASTRMISVKALQAAVAVLPADAPLPTKVTLLTYGDSRFQRAKEQLLQEVQAYVATGLIHKVAAYGPEDLARDDIRFPLQSYIPDLASPDCAATAVRRGGGFWLWKPFLTYIQLLGMKDGDILVYADAGSRLFTDAAAMASWRFCAHRAAHVPCGIVATELEARHSTRRWTRRTVWEQLGVSASSPILDKPQIAGGHFWVRNCYETRQIFQRWWDLAAEHPELFMDAAPGEQQDPIFQDHRHDQSVWTLLLRQLLPPEAQARFVDAPQTTALLPIDVYEDHAKQHGDWYMRFTRRRDDKLRR